MKAVPAVLAVFLFTASFADVASAQTDFTKLFSAGFVVSSTINAQRVSSVKFITRDDGSVYAQVARNPSVQYGGSLSLGFLSPKFNYHNSDEPDWLAIPMSAVFCGPFGFLPKELMPDDSTGCGPIVAGTLTSGSTSSIAQVGIGWAVDAWRFDKNKVALSLGALLNPSDTVLDSNVIDPQTYLVNPNYLTAAKNGSLAGTTTQTTAGIFVMLSYEFGTT